MASEQPQQPLPASTNVPQVLEPRPSQPLVFPDNNPVEVTQPTSVPRPRKARRPQPIIPTTRVLRSMVPKSPTPEPPPPTFARSFFVDTVTNIPNELVHNVTVQEAKSTHGDKVVDDAIMDEIRSLVDDTHALEACRTRERALPMHLLLKAKYLANAQLTNTKRASLSEEISNIVIRTLTLHLSVCECNPFSCYWHSQPRQAYRTCSGHQDSIFACYRQIQCLQEASSLLVTLVSSYVQPCQSRWFNHFQSS